MVIRDRALTFSYIRDKVWQRINYESIKFLLKASHVVMIKSILQAISSYFMNNFFWRGHGVRIIGESVGCHGRNYQCIRFMVAWDL